MSESKSSLETRLEDHPHLKTRIEELLRIVEDAEGDTICTHSLMLAAKDKLTPDQRSRLANIMLLAAERVVGK